jgi:phage gp36-like protein
MHDYCSTSDIQQRLTEAGVKNLADRNRDGSLSGTETTSSLTTAIGWAGTEIDAALTELMPISTARGAANDWLKQRAVDLASFRACSQGGRSVPESLRLDYERSLQLLEEVRTGSRMIPGLTYQLPYDSPASTMRAPRVTNVER